MNDAVMTGTGNDVFSFRKRGGWYLFMVCHTVYSRSESSSSPKSIVNAYEVVYHHVGDIYQTSRLRSKQGALRPLAILTDAYPCS